MKRFRILIALVVITTLTLGITGCGQGNKKIKDPIEVGTSIDTKQPSERDNLPYPVEYTITEIDRDQESVNEQINKYNLSARGHTIGKIKNENLEYGICHYQVYYPVGYPDHEFGITKVALKFTLVGLDGSDNIKVGDVNYKELGQTWEIGDPPMGYDFYSGTTYKGAFVFVMVKGSTDYLIKEEYTEGDKTVTHYIKGM